MTEFRQNNPFRPVDWRWQRAKQLLERNSGPDRYLDDDLICDARGFCAAVGKRKGENRLAKLANDYPDMFEAWQLSEQGDNELAHFEVEARLLADEPSGSIAAKVGMRPGAVDYYESWFFNVRDRLQSPGYITHTVIGKSIQCGLSEREFDVLWKLYGYWGGPHVLDSIIYRGHGSPRPEKPEEVAAFWADDIKQQLRLKAAITVRTMPAGFNQQTILETYHRCLELENAAGESWGDRRHPGQYQRSSCRNCRGPLARNRRLFRPRSASSTSWV